MSYFVIIPHRMKVRAQRKFAQGSPSLITVKEKDRDREKTISVSHTPVETLIEALPDLCPKTEDFLTFLCFRGTQHFPDSIDFFSNASLQNQVMDETTVSSSNSSSGKWEKTSFTDSKSSESKSSDLKSSDVKSSSSKPPAMKLFDSQAADVKPSDPKPTDLKSGSSKQNSKNPDTKCTNQKPAKTTSTAPSDSNTKFLMKPTMNGLKRVSPLPKLGVSRIHSNFRKRTGTVRMMTRLLSRKQSACQHPHKQKIHETTLNKKSTRSSTNLTKRSEPTKVVTRSTKPAVKTVTKPSSIRKPEAANLTKANAIKKDDQTEIKLTRSVARKSALQLPKSPTAKQVEKVPTTTTASRPTRRTKEAATIYLSLLGEEERLDSSDYEQSSASDDSSEAKSVKTIKANADVGRSSGSESASKSKNNRKRKNSSSPVGSRTRRSSMASEIERQKAAIIREASRRFGQLSSDEDDDDASRSSSSSESSASSQGDKFARSMRTRSSYGARSSAAASPAIAPAESRVTRAASLRNSGAGAAASAVIKSPEAKLCKKSFDSNNCKNFSKSNGAKSNGKTDSKSGTVSNPAKKSDGKLESKTDEKFETNSKRPAKTNRPAESTVLVDGADCLVEAPTFYPTEKEFNDPMEYLVKILPDCERFGICRIVPPATFKPECQVSDAMRFTAYNQYIHRMFRRKGSNSRHLEAVQRHLNVLNIDCDSIPCIGGIEVDLPGLYEAVEALGGPKKVLENNLWPKVSDMLKVRADLPICNCVTDTKLIFWLFFSSS